MFDILQDAIEADLVITDAVYAGKKMIDPEHHPLAASVHRHTLTSLITWPFTGLVPVKLAKIPRQQGTRRGPVADRPALSTDERTRFFDHLLVTADAHRNDDNALLRRQAIYLLGFDQRPGSAEWLTDEQHQAMRNVRRDNHVASWVSVRSSAIALALKGNRDPLHAFVATALTNEAQETANLNYWAYWVGEISEAQIDDDFMVDTEVTQWTGANLFDHLLNRLIPGSHHADLNIHTLWALLLARPSVLDHRPRSRTRARDMIERMSTDSNLTTRARQELASVAYAVRLADR